MSVDLCSRALEALQACDPDRKVKLTKRLAAHWDAGRLALDVPHDLPQLSRPGRPTRPPLVPPRKLAKRSMGSLQGRQALVHAVTHIELNAIDLALDAVYRFRNMPRAFYDDWIRVALEEAGHFTLVRDRLRGLGCDYGDFPAHDGLWSLARQTAEDPLARMALVPRVMEARGLDVTPGMIARFRAAGDLETVAVLEVILRDEVGHVRAGTRWLRFFCEQRGLDPEAAYFELLDRHLSGVVRCPLHREARLEAGFSESELSHLEALCDRS
jgi:uncharacterized ferritin-like protein (DUF455 family)